MENLPAVETTKLSTVDENGEPSLAVPVYQHTPLDAEADEQRFLILHPCSGDKMDPENYVHCSLVSQSLFDAEPFIAVKNSRGYRLTLLPIGIDGKALLVPAAIEIFLRCYRDSQRPIRLWIRHVCLVQQDDLECTSYWTRDFVDSMYNMASSVIDMNQYLAEKFDQKERSKVIFLEQPHRRKVWNKLEDNLSAPQVFPTRLGFRPSPNQILERYPYVPLDVTVDEIRVLVIAPAKDSAAPVITGMAHSPVYSTLYHGLSYTWGLHGMTSTITINGQLVEVRQNLEQALRALRRTDQDIAVWIDAVCIDQRDLEERNRQLVRMKEIYDYAPVVISYVGEPDKDSDMALDLIPALQMPMPRHDENRNWDLGPKIEPETIVHRCAALYRFLSRPYFRRAWVVQEVAVASNAAVMCGQRIDVTFEQLQIASSNLASMLRYDPVFAQKIDASYHLQQDSAADPLTYISKLFYFRTLLSRGAGAGTGSILNGTVQYQEMWKENTPGYLEALILVRDFEATDAHDKIFALWNLVADKEGLKFSMSYADSVANSYMKFVKAWSRQHGSLDIIAVAEQNSQSEKFYNNAASWCPDWSVSSLTSCLVRKERIPPTRIHWLGSMDGKLYAADGVPKIADSTKLFFFEGNTLYATGMILDRIDIVFDEIEELPPNMTCRPPCPFTHFKYYHWGIEMLRQHREGRLLMYDNPLQNYVAMVHGDMPSAWPAAAEHPDPDMEPERDEQYVCLNEKSRHIQQFAGSYDRNEARAVMRAVLRGRIPFITAGGYMGLAPYWVRSQQRSASKQPWSLAILAGCSVPVMLQENEDDSGSYTFGGACFVQGWMEGEYLAEQFGVDEPADFWLAMHESQSIIKIV